MPIVMYEVPPSEPCRAVKMTAQELGIELDLKFVNLFAGEQNKPEFLASCHHDLPVNKYAPDSSLYPNDPKKRAAVDRMLYFDLGTIYKAYYDYMRPVVFLGRPADPAKEEECKKALQLLETLLSTTTYAAADHLTLADYSLIGTLSYIEKINPQHCVPTIDDDGFYLWESRAIMTYLVNKYGPDSSLYPKDPKKRAAVDRMLFFDLGTLFKTKADFTRPILFQGLPPDPVKEEEFKKALQLLETFLDKTKYAAGDHLTLADYSIVCTLSPAVEVAGYNLAPYPKISAWMQKMKEEIPNFRELVIVMLKKFKELLESRRK